MIEVKKKDNESTAGLMRRFSQRVKSSGNLPKVRSLRFRASTEIKTEEKRRRLEAHGLCGKTALLKKLGKIE